ncbi:MAG: type IV toxin-antitoxin system AbiEi family antitoxin domain-containing protein [Saprospiraceae bacterium]|nr:type IV toxin-antitoxin system AbiEi family antitoxin domain-containing protein [Saprospiraceae bacterium]MCB9326987.1 type IV toxin-antitoxin system AbiEi family antitoxin domain-containing protein [Lewinellaceae bacterium]
MSKEKTLLEFIREHNGYVRTRDVLEGGFHNHYLNVLVEQGEVLKIKRGLYRLSNLTPDDEMEEISRMIPDGVLCLFTAWNYYELTDFVPPEYHIAIEKNKKVLLPDYPPIKVYFWSEQYWSLGIAEIKIGKTTVKIYEKEKSVCDAIKFRNKIGKEVEKEVLQNYLKEKDRNIEKLLYFARLLRVEAQMKTYLSILL